MRCDEARKLLSSDQEPAEHLLDALFAHVDSCAACEALDGSQSPVEPVLAMSAGAAPSFATNGDFFAKVQSQLNECETVMSVLDSPEQPSEELLSSSFDHVDDCGPCRVELSEDVSPEALRDYTQSRVSPDLSQLADKVWLKVGPCAAALQVLSSKATEEPKAAELDTLFSHIDSCEPCQAREEAASPVLASYAASRSIPEGLFDNFYEKVEERLGVAQSGPMRIGPLSTNSSSSQSWRVGGVVLALAASLLVALTLWQAFVAEQEQGQSGPSQLAKDGKTPNLKKNNDLAKSDPLSLDDFEGLSDFVPGKRVFLQIETEAPSESESFSNETESPDEGFQFRFNQEKPPAQKRRAPRSKGSSDTALSF